MPPPVLSIRLAPLAPLLLHSRIATRITPGRIDTVIADTSGVDPAVLEPLRAAGAQALDDLQRRGGISPLITVRYILDRAIPGLVRIDASEAQIDVYVELGLMPQDIADELAAHATHLARRILPMEP